MDLTKVSKDIETGKLSSIQQKEKNINKKAERQKSLEDWHEVAINMGRLFSMLYAIGQVVTLVLLIIFPNSE